MVYRKFNIKKINQSYLFILINRYKKISSGRKNYSFHYKRVVKNILLSKLYKKNIIPNKDFLTFKDCKFSIEIVYKSK